jgi:hypothetical protein
MKNQTTRFYSSLFRDEGDYPLSLMALMNEERRENASPFLFQDERDYPSITTNANE